jgi:hypothetical protein
MGSHASARVLELWGPFLGTSGSGRLRSGGGGLSLPSLYIRAAMQNFHRNLKYFQGHLGKPSVRYSARVNRAKCSVCYTLGSMRGAV